MSRSAPDLVRQADVSWAGAGRDLADDLVGRETCAMRVEVLDMTNFWKENWPRYISVPTRHSVLSVIRSLKMSRRSGGRSRPGSSRGQAARRSDREGAAEKLNQGGIHHRVVVAHSDGVRRPGRAS